MISGKNPEAISIARAVTEHKKDPQPLVTYLGFAYLASNGDWQAQDHIKKDFKNKELQWHILRALRIVPLLFTVPTLCDLVKGGGYTDEVYDAIVALGRIPSSSSQATTAAQTLTAAVEKMRGKPWQDGMRTAAITALGTLNSETSGVLLVEELIDYNPAVAREAARSIEKILGLATTVARVVEAATKSGAPTTIDAFARALRWMKRDRVAEELETIMGSGSLSQQEIARALLSEIGGAVAYEKLRARTAAMKQYTDVLERAEGRVQELFERTIREAQNGFQLATWMDGVVFAIGVSLIAVSASVALFRTGDIAVWAGAGTTGVAGVLYTLFVSNPRKQVRQAVDHLMNVKIIFLAYLRRLHQTDQAYTRLLLENEKITSEQLKAYSDIVGEVMETTVRQFAALK